MKNSLLLLLGFLPSALGCVDSTIFEFGTYEYNRQVTTRTCAWLTASSQQEATRIAEWCDATVDGTLVKDECAATCDACPTAAPTATPTAAPTLVRGTPSNNNSSDTYSWCQDITTSFETLSPQGATLNKGCQWISKKPGWRCTFPNAKDNCPRTCDVCQCSNNSEEFPINSGYWSGQFKSCSWVERKVEKRCNLEDAAHNCPLVCGKCTPPPPTVEPTSSPTATQVQSLSPTQVPTETYPWCSDSKGRFEINSVALKNNMKTCKWASRKKTFQRCKIIEVLQNCPETCNSCQCTDNQDRFEFKPEIGRAHV